MKQFVMITAMIMLLMSSCNEQSVENEQTKGPEPQTGIKVNREYDEKGNLIRYDSTYAHFYSTITDDKPLKDSLFFAFRSQFNRRYPFLDRPFMDDLFFEDSLLKYDFYKHDFFTERFRRNMQRMDEMFREMDSIKNQYYIRALPEPGDDIPK